MFNYAYWGYFSAFALLAMFPLSWYLFSHERASRAAMLVMLIGVMFLPQLAEFDPPTLPPFDKYGITALCMLLGAYFHARRRLRAARMGRGLDVIVFIMMAGGMATAYTNGDPLTYGGWRIIELAALKPWDGISIAGRQLFAVGVPFMLGRMFLRTTKDLRTLFELLTLAGLVYSVLILYEIRMSPMLHVKVYGFFAHSDWSQQIRFGGYRPTVFLGHGLVVGFFMWMCSTASLALYKAGKRRLFGLPMRGIVIYLLIILLLCKASAMIFYGAVALLLVLKTSLKAQMRVALFLSFLVLTYPISRGLFLFPTDELVSLSEDLLGPDRAQSLQFRFDNEDLLSAKAIERPYFGWGGWGRERVYDSEIGKDLTVQDGMWIIVFGTTGSLGFACYYALQLIPVGVLARRLKNVTGRVDRTLLVALTLMLSVACVNTLPNAEFRLLPFFFAGGLLGLSQALPREARARARAEQAKPHTPEPLVATVATVASSTKNGRVA